MVGILAAIGLALGGISGFAVAVFTGFFKLKPWWQMPLAILGVLVAISGASVIIAALKLRKRNLGPILDANGWAVNGRVKINIPFGAALTKTARLPKGSVRDAQRPVRRHVESDEDRPLGHPAGAGGRGRHELYPVDKRHHRPLVPAPRNPAESRARRRGASAGRSGAQPHGASPAAEPRIRGRSLVWPAGSQEAILMS